jgi:hypothetical protein
MLTPFLFSRHFRFAIIIDARRCAKAFSLFSAFFFFFFFILICRRQVAPGAARVADAARCARRARGAASAPAQRDLR